MHPSSNDIRSNNGLKANDRPAHMTQRIHGDEQPKDGALDRAHLQLFLDVQSLGCIGRGEKLGISLGEGVWASLLEERGVVVGLGQFFV
ncbi:hypothetical protein B0T14DRAFT_522672 [Immersiella caudata]|uniref:Uncharacterized protein n=1 Tax=Immersiella caudata TaxID=314043 RepID=A0AA39WIS6_9PEZI|nr:hypothetical protein B0T14DRAFT_522672 [Immersiella caudata]